MAGGIAKCRWAGGAEFYALPMPGSEINGMAPFRALTKGPRFSRGDKIMVRKDEIIGWVNQTPDMPVEKDELMPGGFEG